MLRSQEKNQEAAQTKNSQQYHQKASELHEIASKFHEDAGKFYKSGDDKAALHHAQLAHGYARQAIEHRYLLEHPADRMKQDHKMLHEVLKLTPNQESAWKILVQSEQAMANSMHEKSNTEAKLTTLEHEEKMLACLKERQLHLTEHVAAIKGLYAVIRPEQKKVFDDFHTGLRAAHDR